MTGGGFDSGALTTGDRLTRIENRLDTIIGTIGKMAEEADVRALEARITALERQEAVTVALKANRRWLVGVTIGMAAWTSVIVSVITLLHH